MSTMPITRTATAQQSDQASTLDTKAHLALLEDNSKLYEWSPAEQLSLKRRVWPRLTLRVQIQKSNLLLTVFLVFVSLVSVFNAINWPWNKLTNSIDIKPVTKDGKQLYEDLLKPMENPYYKTGMENGQTVPVLFIQIGGDLTRDKICLANKALCEWQVRLRMK